MIRVTIIALLLPGLGMSSATADDAPSQEVFHLNAQGEREVGYAQAIRVGDTIW